MTVINQEMVILKRDLPICCPPHNIESWNMHPRVYLKENKTGKVQCPYCSTQYIVQD